MTKEQIEKYLERGMIKPKDRWYFKKKLAELSKESDFTITYDGMSEKQIEVIESKEKFIIASGAVRSGKTHIMIVKLLQYLTQNQGKTIIITGKTTGAIFRNVVEPISKMLKFKWKYKKSYGGKFILFGNNIYLFGTDTRSRWEPIRGMEASCWYANEASLQDVEAIEETFRRLSESPRLILWDTNPHSPNHWLYTNYILNQKKRNPKICKFTIYDNKGHIDPDYLKDLENSYKDTYLEDRYLYGEWVAEEGTPFIHIPLIEAKLPAGGIAFIDPSYGGSSDGKGGSSTAVAYLSRIGGQFYCLGRLYKKAYYDCYEEIIKEGYNTFGVKLFICEENLTGGAIKRDLTRLGVRAIGVRNYQNKKERIFSIAPMVMRGEIALLKGTDESFESEVRFFNPDSTQTDSPDALESGIRWLLQGKEGFSLL